MDIINSVFKVRYNQKTGSRHLRKSTIGYQQGDGPGGRHQDDQEMQDRDGGRPHQDTQGDTDYVERAASQHYSHLRRYACIPKFSDEHNYILNI